VKLFHSQTFKERFPVELIPCAEPHDASVRGGLPMRTR
jgi:hypothetical protein